MAPKQPIAPGARLVPAETRASIVPWRTTWPVFLVVALCLGGVSFINSVSVLECVREPRRPGQGLCTLERGSWAFAYTEEFFVAELKGATVEGQDSPMPNRRLDGGAERIYIHTDSGSYRFIDNNLWSHDERVAVAARIEAFARSETEPHLLVRFDRRLALLVQGFAVSALAGALWALVRHLRARRRT